MDITRAKQIAEELISKHLQSHGHWDFRFDNSRSRLGSCRFRRTMVIDGHLVTYPISGGTITLSKAYAELNTQEAIVNTILHEIAHALCGPYVGHSKLWKQTARSIGCRAQRCYDPRTLILPPAKYIAECPKCGRQIEYNKRRVISCAQCDAKKFNRKYLMRFRKNPQVFQIVSDDNTLTEPGSATESAYDNTEVSNR